MPLHKYQTFVVTVVVNEDVATGDELTDVARCLEHALSLVTWRPAIVRSSVELGPDTHTIGDET